MLEVLAISQVISWLAVIGLTLAVFALARQIGVLHERVAPMGALMTDRAYKVGDAAPDLDLTSLSGAPVHVGGRRADGRNQLLLFVSPTCPVCKKLLPVAKSFARRERSEVELTLVGDGEREAQERFIREQRLEDVPYVVSPQLGMQFQVGKLPYAILIDEEGVIRSKGLVNSREHLESLLVARETGYASIQEYLQARG
jgi:methylamine dehydrogenase accessory protein MauD